MLSEGFFSLVSSLNWRGQAVVFSFQIETTEKKFGRHLVLSFWFLVTGWSNEKNIWISNFATRCTAARKMYTIGENSLACKLNIGNMHLSFSCIEESSWTTSFNHFYSKALNFKSFSPLLEQFFLTVGQNNFSNKIPFTRLTKIIM